MQKIVKGLVYLLLGAAAVTLIVGYISLPKSTTNAPAVRPQEMNAHIISGLLD